MPPQNKATRFLFPREPASTAPGTLWSTPLTMYPGGELFSLAMLWGLLVLLLPVWHGSAGPADSVAQICVSHKFLFLSNTCVVPWIIALKYLAIIDMGNYLGQNDAHCWWGCKPRACPPVQDFARQMEGRPASCRRTCGICHWAAHQWHCEIQRRFGRYVILNTKSQCL